jgi:hypothetical protein
MDDLDQDAISKVLGSTIRPVGHVGFGAFDSRSTAEEIRNALRGGHRDVRPPSPTERDAAAIVRAFEEIRDGASIDELLWNKDLAVAFAGRCRECGLEMPRFELIRGLFRVRKHAARYRAHGIAIRPAARKPVHPGIVPEYAHVIEFALVKLRYRYGASIDQILMDEVLGEKFEDLVHQVAPSLSGRDARLGALSIRKHREIKRGSLEKLDALDLDVIETAWRGTVRLSNVRLEEIPVSPGLIELKEEDRYLYVAHNADLRSAVGRLSTGQAFRLMTSTFWKPRLESITLSFAKGQRVGGTSVETWERKLIHDRNPVFNWPVPDDQGQIEHGSPE